MEDLVFMLLRFLHFLFGIMWIGLLYYFNFVQTPFFGETDPAVRSGAIQKLVPRALWWFRWGAMGTVIFGLLYLLIWWAMRLNYAMTPWTVAIFTGGFLGLFMWANVWFVIWPNQKIVIGNATAMAGGAPANPAAAPAGNMHPVVKLAGFSPDLAREDAQTSGGKDSSEFASCQSADVRRVANSLNPNWPVR